MIFYILVLMFSISIWRRINEFVNRFRMENKIFGTNFELNQI